MNNHQTLDSIESTTSNKNSRFSLFNFIITVIVFLCFMIQSLVRISRWHLGFDNELMQQILSIVFLISSISGFSFAFKSFRSKEKKTIIHKIGIIGNLLFFVITLMLLITLISDISKFM